MPRKPRDPATQDEAGGDLLDRPGFITPEELAPFLKVEVATLDTWASRGGGPVFHKMGSHRRYLGADVKDWLRANRRAKTSDQRPAA